MSRFLASFGYALAGIGHAYRKERNIRIHTAALAAVCLLGALIGLARWEWAAVLGASALVMTAELVNTAVERTVDLIGGEPRPLGKAAKDTAAGAVLLAALFAIAIGAVVFVPHLWRLAAAMAGLQ